METMSHRQRLAWLVQHGFTAEERGCTLPEMGFCVWVDGQKGERSVSLWLSVRDGCGIIHGVNEGTLAWADLVEWIEPTKQPELVRVVSLQRNLFGDDE